MASQVPNPEGLPEIKDEPFVEAPHERRTVTLLHLLLMDLSLEALFQFLQRLGYSYTISQTSPQRHVMTIRREGGLKYQAQGIGVKGAMTNALANLLLDERRDFHDVVGR